MMSASIYEPCVVALLSHAAVCMLSILCHRRCRVFENRAKLSNRTRAARSRRCICRIVNTTSDTSSAVQKLRTTNVNMKFARNYVQNQQVIRVASQSCFVQSCFSLYTHSQFISLRRLRTILHPQERSRLIIQRNNTIRRERTE
jgi:hypothetical protein